MAPDASPLDSFLSTRKATNPSVQARQARAAPARRATHRPAAYTTVPTHASSNISKLSTADARALQTAHALLDASSVIKELVENSLDANAHRIEVRIRGKAALDSITVSDDGSGVSQNDYHTLCQQSSTSKLTDFSELSSINTLGFRGEALSAICAFAESVTITTRTSADATATKLCYDATGALVSRNVAARPVGTTVHLEHMMYALPVRRAAALKNAPRELNKCIATIQALALISVDTRIELRVANELKVLSQPAPSRRAHKVQSASGTAIEPGVLRETALSVLGKRAASHLIEVSCAQLKPVLLPVGTEGLPGAQAYFGCTGLVSTASLDADGKNGRAMSAHQYIYANRRSVHLPRLNRSLNELYRRATGRKNATPLIILNICMPASTLDVNVTPDKRELYVQDEAGLVNCISEHLEGIWCPKRSVEMPIRKLDKSLVRRAPAVEVLGGNKVGEAARVERECARVPAGGTVAEAQDIEMVVASRGDEDVGLKNGTDEPVGKRRAGSAAGVEVEGKEDGKRGGGTTGVELQQSRLRLASSGGKRNVSSFIARRAETRQPVKRARVEREDVGGEEDSSDSDTGSEGTTERESKRDQVVVVLDSKRSAKAGSKSEPVVHFDWEKLLAKGGNNGGRAGRDGSESRYIEEGKLADASMAGMEDCESNGNGQGSLAAERAMRRVFRQEWFEEMRIIGQFNRGFIICALGQDLFIIDQHASDEKCNYERLEAQHVSATQRLVRPLALRLCAQDELLVQQHLSALKAGGYEMEWRGERAPTERVYLKTQPTSGRGAFVQDDVMEVLGRARDARGAEEIRVLRATRHTTALATRACRMSIMIGTALTRQQMTALVGRLRRLRHPWTCPHGRPTMRHLCSMLDYSDA